MKPLPAKLLGILSLLLVLFSINACQKESLQAPDVSAQNTLQSLPASDRVDRFNYGVTRYTPTNPSIITTILTLTGGAVNGVQVFIRPFPDKVVLIDDLKGVCVVNGEVFVSTGANNVVDYVNTLLKVDPFTGEGTVLSHSSIGTVSDIDYDETTGTIYGLRNNTNALVSITNNGNNWGSYAYVKPITNLGLGYIAKGLSMIRFGENVFMVVAATRTSGGNARIYKMPAATGSATLLTNVNPANELATGHCGIGFDVFHNILIINRRPTNLEHGLNAFKWSNQLPNPISSVVWDTTGFTYEDLSTNLQ